MEQNEKEKQTADIDFKHELDECKRKKEEYLAGWQRARADLLNYKKEEMERIRELMDYAKEEFILKVLPILDNFDLAEKAIPESLKTNDNIKGILQIRSQFLDFLLVTKRLDRLKSCSPNCRKRTKYHSN